IFAWANPPEPTIQSAVGGNRANNAYIELVVRGATARICPILRRAPDMSGGFIASCRNPVRASYVKAHAALGGIAIALALGEAIIAAERKGGAAVIDAICTEMKGAIIGKGKVARKAVQYTSEAFDIGTLHIGAGASELVLHVMNEYMAAEDAGGRRLASYPDVIATLDRDGVPASVGEIREGMELFVLRIPKDVIPLSSSVIDPSVYPACEKALGINLTDYALARGAERWSDRSPLPPARTCAARAGGRKAFCGFWRTCSRWAKIRTISWSTPRSAAPRATGPRMTPCPHRKRR